MRLLVLGGTKYLGRHLVEAALRDGHDVTLFNRGQTGQGLFPTASQLRGDRSRPDALAEGEWDGVVDFSGFVGTDVRRTAELLADRVGQYTFMSTIGVYADKVTPYQTEAAPLVGWPDGTADDAFSMDVYGAQKVRCEQILTDVLGERATYVRSGFIVGRYGPDFGPWGQPLAEGRQLDCAARPDQPLQYLDARDLADFLLKVTAERRPGPFNAVSPTLTIEAFLDAWQRVARKPVPVDWNPATDYLGLPHDGSNDGTFQLDNTRALKAGLRVRAAGETAADYIAWIREGNTPPPPPH
ncbi:NAD-dependent dehydratase [Kribbella sp. NBC_01245]|uniref:NAD-dependent epimerase/dehydratase family protein n=1 Tax=Kribbella sp. NBC_01245 TaxID=2903578 RepID=UPI002E2935B0|nr:NAD-dependent epimerase/dehydratase family protein [Kribbella sp. NBC_01245]